MSDNTSTAPKSELSVENHTEFRITPYYQHAGITIYHGDCRDILPMLPKVDLVLTDPPYPGLSGGIEHMNGDVYKRQLLWIEFKAGKKGAQKHQLEWHAKERALGFVTLIANEDFPATIDGFKNWYEKSGYMRRDKWW